MKILSTLEAAKELFKFPELRVSDIPIAGMILEGSIYISVNPEGEVTLFDLDPNAG